MSSLWEQLICSSSGSYIFAENQILPQIFAINESDVSY